MKRHVLLIIAVLLSCCSMVAQAIEVEGLYEAEMQVASQARSERATAMVSALLEVFTKVSGIRDIAAIRGIAKALRKPGKYLQQYQYREIKLVANQLARYRAEQRLWFRFDASAVNRTLNQNKLPVWGKTRPSTLVLLIIEEGGLRYLLGADTYLVTGNQRSEYFQLDEKSNALRRALLDESQRRGLAVLLPLLDLTDQQNIQVTDIWGDFPPAVQAVARRYRAEAILVGRLNERGLGELTGRWTLYEGGRIDRWAVDGALPVEVLDEGVIGALGILSSRYAQVYGRGQTRVIPITVLDVDSIEDYARIGRYLEGLGQVEQLFASEVEPSRITFQVEYKGEPEGLFKTISLGDVLASGTDMPLKGLLRPRTAGFGKVPLYRLLK